MPATRRASGPMLAPRLPAPMSVGAPIRLMRVFMVSSGRLKFENRKALAHREAAGIDEAGGAPGLQGGALGLVQPAQLIQHLHRGGEQGGLVAVADLQRKGLAAALAADHLHAV